MCREKLSPTGVTLNLQQAASILNLLASYNQTHAAAVDSKVAALTPAPPAAADTPATTPNAAMISKPVALLAIRVLPTIVQ